MKPPLFLPCVFIFFQHLYFICCLREINLLKNASPGPENTNSKLIFPGRDPDYTLFVLSGVCQLSHTFRPVRNYTSIGLECTWFRREEKLYYCNRYLNHILLISWMPGSHSHVAYHAVKNKGPAFEGEKINNTLFFRWITHFFCIKNMISAREGEKENLKMWSFKHRGFLWNMTPCVRCCDSTKLLPEELSIWIENS